MYLVATAKYHKWSDPALLEMDVAEVLYDPRDNGMKAVIAGFGLTQAYASQADIGRVPQYWCASRVNGGDIPCR